MARDHLDMPLVKALSEAAHAAVEVRRAGHRFDPLRPMGFTADALADRLEALGAHAHEAYAHQQEASTHLELAEDEARLLAERAFAWRTRLRHTVSALAAVHGEPVATAVADLRRLLRVTRPRLLGLLDEVRRIRDELQRPHHPLCRLPLARGFLPEALALEAELAVAARIREDARRVRRAATARKAAAHAELIAALRETVRLWRLACVLRGGEDVAILRFASARSWHATRVRRVRRRAGGGDEARGTGGGDETP